MKYTATIDRLHQDVLLKREKQEKLRALSMKIKSKSEHLADLNVNVLLMNDDVWCDKSARLPLEIFTFSKFEYI
ncbi:hypothetical protein [Listeria ilorinensis]|uniref:hypothetical protein n=1 Tax=Listeria ilorinensis TaxID=2867439 RepID=UPI001EF53959|nr:hypothetical protein [Listeria ilorinensis]